MVRGLLDLVEAIVLHASLLDPLDDTEARLAAAPARVAVMQASEVLACVARQTSQRSHICPYFLASARKVKGLEGQGETMSRSYSPLAKTDSSIRLLARFDRHSFCFA